MQLTGIVGTGAVGSNLARALHAHGYPIHCLISRTATAEHALVIETNARHVVQPGNPLPEGLQLVFLCVPDDQIGPTAQRLTEMPYSWDGVVVAHVSGALPSNELFLFKEQGAHIMSFHPMQTFASMTKTHFDGIFVGIEGDPEAVATGAELAVQLNARPLTLSASDKTLYHASAVVASNFLVTLTSISMNILQQIGLDRQDAQALLTPLIRTTSHNVINSLPENVLTGPAARGDQATLERHIEALRMELPQYSPLYRLMTEHTLHLAASGRKISPEQLDHLLDAISCEKDE